MPDRFCLTLSRALHFDVEDFIENKPVAQRCFLLIDDVLEGSVAETTARRFQIPQNSFLCFRCAGLAGLEVTAIASDVMFQIT